MTTAEKFKLAERFLRVLLYVVFVLWAEVSLGFWGKGLSAHLSVRFLLTAVGCLLLAAVATRLICFAVAVFRKLYITANRSIQTMETR